MAKNFSYCDSKNSRHGRMVCYACGKPIMSGLYRVRYTDEAFITHHRACSLDDKHWAKLDAQKSNQLAYYEKRLAAFKEFREKWNTDALDEEIESMERERQ